MLNEDQYVERTPDLIAKVRQMRALYPEVDVVVVYQRDFVELLARHGLDPTALGAA